jgi:ABC-type multidrug transport system ATPase subunit
VEENLQFFGELGGLCRSALKQQIRSVSGALRLLPLLDRPARLLSGGQMRLLHLGMALISAPRLLLLDEPTAELDLEARAEVMALIREAARQGSAVLYCTHHLYEAEQLGGCVAIIDAGRLVANGSLEALLGRYGRSAVELRFDGAAPRLRRSDVRVNGSTLQLLTDESPALAAASLLTQLGTSTQRLQHIELIRPSLESVYREVVGTERKAEVTP